MIPWSRVAGFVFVSSVVHCTIFFSMQAWQSSQPSDPEALLVSLVEAPPQETPKPVTKVVAPIPTKSVPAPRPKLPRAFKEWTQATPPKTGAETTRAPQLSVASQAPRPATTTPAPEPVRSSAELLTDPQKGPIFENYFVTVKTQIHEIVRKKYTRAGVGEGTVSLVFILRSDGALENVFVADQLSEADLLLKTFAKNCVRDAAPFPRFPVELDIPKISFNVTVLFEDLS